jgi:hypothetical protein
MRCKHPERRQRLHLVAVSLQEKDPERLRAQLLQALQCSTSATGKSEMPAFESVDVLPPLTGYYVNGPSIKVQLRITQAKIRGLAQGGAPATDLVVFYYQGAETVNTEGSHYLAGNAVTGDGTDLAAFSCDELVDLFSKTPGAHVVLLDVGRGTSLGEGARDKIAKWEESYGDIRLNIMVLRYAWLGQTDKPQPIRLVEGLREAMPRVTRLAELTDRVRQFAELSPYFHKELAYDQWLPADMKEIAFGGGH